LPTGREFSIFAGCHETLSHPASATSTKITDRQKCLCIFQTHTFINCDLDNGFSGINSCFQVFNWDAQRFGEGSQDFIALQSQPIFGLQLLPHCRAIPTTRVSTICVNARHATKTCY
jgi:hypothetical protein